MSIYFIEFFLIFYWMEMEMYLIYVHSIFLKKDKIHVASVNQNIVSVILSLTFWTTIYFEFDVMKKITITHLPKLS